MRAVVFEIFILFPASTDPSKTFFMRFVIIIIYRFIKIIPDKFNNFFAYDLDISVEPFAQRFNALGECVRDH